MFGYIAGVFIGAREQRHAAIHRKAVKKKVFPKLHFLHFLHASAYEVSVESVESVAPKKPFF